MFRFKQPDAGGRMPTMAVMPSKEDLQFLLAQAQKNWRRPVELSFKTVGGTQVFKIAVQCDMTTGDPVWTLTRVSSTASNVIWAQTTGDVGLINELIDIEFKRATADEEGARLAAQNAPAAQATAAGPQSATVEADLDHEEPEVVDAESMAIHSVLRALCRPETGLFTYPAFLYFVDQEYRRFRRGGLPFSVAVFQMNFREPNGMLSSQPFPAKAATEVALHASKAKRDLDLLAHYGTFDFALLLPHTDTEGAAVLVKRIETALKSQPLMPGINGDRLAMFFGIANMPSDADRPRTLVSAAADAQRQAVEGPENIVLYRDRRR